MTRRLVVCTCSREQAGLTEHELRRAGWRLVPASVPLPALAESALHGETYAWVCPTCTDQRNALLRARSAS